MRTYLVIGNIFSLFSALCIWISVVQKNKKQLMLWQIGDTFFGIFANIALYAYAALVISIICFIRNILSYQNKLTKNITIVLLILSVIIGLYANNRGVIGWLPIIASASFTVLIYVTKNEQQMRYSMVSNTILWFIHNFYVQAYPSAIANIVLCLWTIVQIRKNKTPHVKIGR